ACVSSRAVAMASAVGRDLDGLAVLSRGLNALADAGVSAIGATQGPRPVDVQFIVERDALAASIKALHRALVEDPKAALPKAA
ncbi:MAG: aspartate kinase, partial [Paracoccus sp. (in: a-proteobacteria)]